jgi:hypothetical protein
MVPDRLKGPSILLRITLLRIILLRMILIEQGLRIFKTYAVGAARP